MSSRDENSLFGDEEHPDAHPDASPDRHPVDELFDQDQVIAQPHEQHDLEPGHPDEHVHEHPDEYEYVVADDTHDDLLADLHDHSHEDHVLEDHGHDSPVDIFGTPARGRHQPRTRSEARARHVADPDGGRLKSLVLPIIALAVLVGLGFGAYQVFAPMVTKALAGSQAEDYPGPGSGEAKVTVHAGDNGGVIARALVDAGVIASSAAFVEASNADPSAAAAIQPGEYTLRKEMKAADALAALNDAGNRYLGERVTLREGLWKSEIFAALSEATGIPVADYEAAAEDASALGLPDQAGGNVEGWLFPATYTLRTDDSAATHLKILIDEMKKQLQAAQAPEEDWQHILTIASMVEGEARDPEDAGKVARVIENRLDNPTGPTVGFLQMDSTVNYALQKRGNLTRGEYEEAKSNPYDTYAFKGMPPGPIGNPGRMAIDAATNPPEGDWFFFVTVNLDTGETLFAETFDEHNRYDQQRVAWCQDNPGKCTGGG